MLSEPLFRNLTEGVFEEKYIVVNHVIFVIFLTSGISIDKILRY